jgi:hypothetical protein
MIQPFPSKYSSKRNHVPAKTYTGKFMEGLFVLNKNQKHENASLVNEYTGIFLQLNNIQQYKRLYC